MKKAARRRPLCSASANVRGPALAPFDDDGKELRQARLHVVISDTEADHSAAAGALLDTGFFRIGSGFSVAGFEKRLLNGIDIEVSEAFFVERHADEVEDETGVAVR